MHSIPMSLKNMFLLFSISFCLKLCYYTPMFVCYYVFIRVLLSHTKAPPSFWGWGCVPRERENQINTLVLKDINFTINIIELSYYRTIDTLNQSKKMLPWYRKKADPQKASPSPSKGGDVPNPTYMLSSFQTISNKDIPS